MQYYLPDHYFLIHSRLHKRNELSRVWKLYMRTYGMYMVWFFYPIARYFNAIVSRYKIKFETTRARDCQAVANPTFSSLNDRTVIINFIILQNYLSRCLTNDRSYLTLNILNIWKFTNWNFCKVIENLIASIYLSHFFTVKCLAYISFLLSFVITVI